jgi:transcription initiation factor IIF auxiliary subunit
MEENLNKKTILILFIISLGIFLFIYKGLFSNGEIYRYEYENFRISLSSHNNTSLKKGKGNYNNNHSSKNKNKIPIEYSIIDNGLLNIKSAIQNSINNNENIINSLNLIIEQFSNDNINEEKIQNFKKEINKVKQSINEIKSSKDKLKSLDSTMDDVLINFEKIRNFTLN